MQFLRKSRHIGLFCCRRGGRSCTSTSGDSLQRESRRYARRRSPRPEIGRSSGKRSCPADCLAVRHWRRCWGSPHWSRQCIPKMNSALRTKFCDISCYSWLSSWHVIPSWNQSVLEISSRTELADGETDSEYDVRIISSLRDTFNKAN